MYVRLAFAVAAHLEPEILLIDEVLAVGDTQFPEKVSAENGRGRGERRTHRHLRQPFDADGGAALSSSHLAARRRNRRRSEPSDEVIQKYSNVAFVDQDRINWPEDSNAGVHELKFTSVGLLDKTAGQTTAL